MKQMAWLQGFTPQSPGVHTSVALNSFDSKLMVNVAAPPHRGILLSFGIIIRNAVMATLGAALDVRLQWAFDGASSPTEMPLFKHLGAGINVWSDECLTTAVNSRGNGQALDDFLTLQLGISFQSAAILTVLLNAAPDSGTPRPADFAAYYALAPDL